MTTETNDVVIQGLAVESLQDAIRYLTIQEFKTPETPSVDTFRRVERLMRIAIAVAGQGGSGIPHVNVHNLPHPSEPELLPGMLSVPLTDLLAARASESLPGVLDHNPDAILAFRKAAEHLLLTEDIQLG